MFSGAGELELRLLSDVVNYAAQKLLPLTRAVLPWGHIDNVELERIAARIESKHDRHQAAPRWRETKNVRSNLSDVIDEKDPGLLREPGAPGFVEFLGVIRTTDLGRSVRQAKR